MGLVYLPINWGGAKGVNGAAYMTNMECLGILEVDGMAPGKTMFLYKQGVTSTKPCLLGGQRPKSLSKPPQ